MHDRIVIPIHNPKGELVAYAGRSIDGSEPRYKFPAGFHKSLELEQWKNPSDAEESLLRRSVCLRQDRSPYRD